MTKRRRFTDAEKAEAVRRFEAGENPKDFCGDYGVYYETIHRWRDRLAQRRPVSAREAALAEFMGLEPVDDTPTQRKAEAVKRYLAGESAVQVGKALGVSNSSVGNWVRAAGHKVRSMSEAVGVGEAKQKEAVRRYLDGESAYSIRKALGVDSNSVRRWVRAAGRKVRSGSEAKGITKAKQEEAVKRYLAGESAVQIGKALGVGHSSVTKWVLAAGYKVRSLSETQGGGEAKQKEAVRRYVAGESSIQICKALGVSNPTIGKWVRAAGYKMRSNSEAHGGSEAKQKEVVRRYLAGENTVQIGKALGVGSTSVTRWVLAAGHKMRSLSETRGGGEAKQKEAIRLVESGMNYVQAAKAVGVSPSSVSRWHKAHLAKQGPTEREKILADFLLGDD